MKTVESYSEPDCRSMMKLVALIILSVHLALLIAGCTLGHFSASVDNASIGGTNNLRSSLLAP